MAKGKSKEKPDSPRVLHNRKARFDYEIVNAYEAGIVLVGSEVKSIWQGKANIADAYCVIKDGELWLVNMDIEPYEHSSHFQHERRRDRKLLMHRKEIDLLARRSQEKGFAIVATKVYFTHGKVKVEIGLGRGKRAYDKREQIAKDESRRELERARSEKF
jgi:SsrA-binding protein